MRWLLALQDGQTVETVGLPRDGVCVSSQVGCAVGCVFCMTGKEGLIRQVGSAEIVAQVAFARLQRVVKKVVFMGMGEPLANEEAVWGAVERIHGDIGLSARHLTISTVGIVPGIRKLATRPLPVNLAVSLHAARDVLRDELVPINKRYPINELMQACRDYLDSKNRRISFEWAMIDGINDQPRDARELAQLCGQLTPSAHVNLIPLNPTPGSEWDASPKPVEREFVARVREQGVSCTVRDTRGQEIAAACGQLAAEDR